MLAWNPTADSKTRKSTHASRSMQQFEMLGAKQPLCITYGNEWAMPASGGESTKMVNL